TPVTALFSAGPKAAAFALLLRIFATVPAATHFWFWAFWILAVLTMFAGNLGALVQTNVKRLLAYSSIAHAGYILVAFAAVTFLAGNSEAGAATAYAAVLFYLVSYALVKLGAYYPLRLSVCSDSRDPTKETAPAVVGFPFAVNLVLAITAIGTVYFGLFPNRILNFVLQSNLINR